MADLALPDYMSRIVNVGLQKGGVENSAPEAVRKTEMDKLLLFMSDQNKQLVLNNYTLDKANSDAKLIKKYPVMAQEDALVMNQGLDKSTIDSLNNAFGAAWLTVSGFEQMLNAPAADQTSDSTQQMPPALLQFMGYYMNLNKTTPTDIFVVMQNYPDKANLVDAINGIFASKTAALGITMINQAATTDVKSEYVAMGADASKIQSSYIWQIGMLMLLLSLASAACTVAVAFIAARTAAGVGRNLRKQVFEKVERFSNTEFDKFSTASLITRTTNDITQIQMLLVIMIRMIFYAPILGIGGVIKAIEKSPSMSWIIGVAVLVLISLILVVFSIAVPKFKLVQKLVDRLNLVTRENLTGMMVIRAFNTQGFESERFDKANKDLTKVNLFVNRVMVVMMPVMMLVMNAVTLLIVWIGAHQIANSTMQIGDMMAFMQYAMQILMAFLMLSFMFILIPRASVSATRISEVLETEASIVDPKNPKHFEKNFSPVLEFKNVTFNYPNAELPALRNISFTALPGQTTAIIGSTGSGKTTLVNLIPRFYDATDGQVTIDGIDVRDLTQNELRENIGYIPQKTSLFSGTIESNLRYGAPDAKEEDLIKAAETAQAMEFITEKPEGLNSEIQEGGGNVSGGQKQRLSIARALARKAPIYVFDDSFSSLDFITDSKLRKALVNYTKNSTILLVAQRISTIMGAQQIIVLNDGEIVGIGTHKELLKDCPTYSEIAYSQLSKEELE